MNDKIIVSLLVGLCLGTNVHGQVKDSLFMKNGQLLIGELKKIELGLLQFDADDVGLVNIKLEKIKGLSASSNTYRVETTMLRRYLGTISPGIEDGSIHIHTPQSRITTRLENVTELTFVKKGFWQRIDGNITLGYNYSRSSNIGRFNFDSKLVYKAEQAEVDLTSSMIITQEQDTSYRERESLSMIGYYYYQPTWFGLVLTSYQRNLQLGIIRRIQEGLGIGKKFLLHKHMQALAISGVSINQEYSIQELYSGTLVEIPFILQWNYFRFSDPDIQLSTSQTLYASISQKGRYRLDGETRLSWEIIEDFSVSVSFYNNYDSQPPSEGGETLDFSIVTGLTYKF